MYFEGKNNELYPTPKQLIEKIFTDFPLKRMETILEPSSGTGNICDWIRENNKYAEIDCIEINPNLQSVLKGKKYHVVHDDFLTYQTRKHYDLIVMNPPFSNGSSHLLKALEMQRNGGYVICILNAETIKNPYCNERKYLCSKLKEYNAQIIYLENEFVQSERSTNVEIAVVTVCIPYVQHESKIWKELQEAEKVKEYEIKDETALVHGDFFEAIIQQYNLEIDAGLKLIREYKELQSHLLRSWDNNSYYKEYTLQLYTSKERLSENEYIESVREKYWKELLRNPKFTAQLTSNLQNDYFAKIKQLKKYEFSKYNISKMKEDIESKIAKGIEDSIIELFDELSYQHSWYPEMEKNILHYNGWKTNKSYMINNKVILPLYVWEKSWDGKSGKWNYTGYNGAMSKLLDIEKCLNYIDRGNTKVDVHLKDVLKDAEQKGQNKKIETKYFIIDFYKKGTAHLFFKDSDLLKKFNIYGSQKKNWLPHEYGKKSYQEMTPEEKNVVDAFDGGKQQYEKICENSSYYVLENNTSINLLEANCSYMNLKKVEIMGNKY